MEIGDKMLKDSMCWVLVHIEKTEDKITFVWRELVKNFLETQMVKIDGDWRKASEFFPPDEYPNSVKDFIQTFRETPEK